MQKEVRALFSRFMCNVNYEITNMFTGNMFHCEKCFGADVITALYGVWKFIR